MENRIPNLTTSITNTAENTIMKLKGTALQMCGLSLYNRDASML